MKKLTLIDSLPGGQVSLDIVQVQYPFDVSFLEYPDNESDSVVVYFRGCDFECRGCHNSGLHEVVPNDKSAKFFSQEDFYEELKSMCVKYRTKKVVFMGGDPLAKRNRYFVKEFLFNYREEFDIAIYTGYSRIEVLQMDVRFFKYLKCGQYDETQKQISGKFDSHFVLSSANQEWCNNHFEVLSKDGIMFFE